MHDDTAALSHHLLTVIDPNSPRFESRQKTRVGGGDSVKLDDHRCVRSPHQHRHDACYVSTKQDRSIPILLIELLWQDVSI
jgi:hypothetical protein